MPRANSRSSASAIASFSPISSTVPDKPLSPSRALSIRRSSAKRHELLLRAVVQVALDPPARVVGGLDDPQPRHPQLLHPRAQLGLQALVVDRQRGGGRGRGDELRRRVELGVVDDRRHPHALVLDRRPRAPRAGVGQLDLAAGVVDEDLALGQPVGDVQGAIAEPLGQHLAHRPALDRARVRSSRRASRAHRVPDRPRAPRSRRSSPAAPARTARARRAGPSAHGPTSRPSSPASPLTPSPASTTASSAGASPSARPASTVGSLSSSIAGDAPVRAVAELLAHAAARTAAAARAGGATRAAGSPGGARPRPAAT